MTPISIMFKRFGINENCAEVVPNHFVPIIQDSRKVFVKRHWSYNLCPKPIKKLPKTSIEQARTLSLLKSKGNNTSYVNSQLPNPSTSKISTSPKVKPSILTIKNYLSLLTKKLTIKYRKIPVTLMSIILHQFQMKTMNAVLKSTLPIHFLLLVKVNLFLTYTLVFLMRNFSLN